MDVLFVGGSGLISSACVDLAVEQGHDVWVLNRGRTRNVPLPEPVRLLTADVHDPDAVREVLRGRQFDVVAQFVGFEPGHVAADLELFAGAGQYVYVSSASAYQKPPRHYLVTESTPLENPFWQYSRDKIACERVLTEAHAATGFPVTIVRPSLTYGPSQLPAAVNSWARPYTLLDWIRRGEPAIVPGDGTSLWVMTHNSDFAVGFNGLFGHPGAIGTAVHITSDEVLSWDAIVTAIADAAGVEPALLHVPSDFLVAADPDSLGSLVGDKSNSVVFDNTLIRSLVPAFAPKVPFAAGMRESVAWFDAEPARQQVDEATQATWRRVLDVYGQALREIRNP